MKKLSKAISSFSMFAMMSVLFTQKAFAQFVSMDNYELPGPDGDLMEWFLKIINWFIGFSALVAVVFIVYAGFMYITATGDENKIGKATKTLTFAIVGLVVCFIAAMIVNFIITSFLS